jgi:hypothetical protein
MEIEVFDSKSARATRIYKPSISISKIGVFTLNKLAVEALNLVAGNTISLVRDKSNPRDWYIMRDHSGITLRQVDNGCLAFNSGLIRSLMHDSFGNESKNGRMRFPVSKEPVQFKDKIMYAIITSKQL